MKWNERWVVGYIMVLKCRRIYKWFKYELYVEKIWINPVFLVDVFCLLSSYFFIIRHVFFIKIENP